MYSFSYHEMLISIQIGEFFEFEFPRDLLLSNEYHSSLIDIILPHPNLTTINFNLIHDCTEIQLQETFECILMWYKGDLDGFYRKLCGNVLMILEWAIRFNCLKMKNAIIFHVKNHLCFERDWMWRSKIHRFGFDVIFQICKRPKWKNEQYLRQISDFALEWLSKNKEKTITFIEMIKASEIETSEFMLHQILRQTTIKKRQRD
jgi:hypothetical protein